MLKTMELYDLEHTLAKDYLQLFEYPWQALKGIKNLILELGPALGEEYTEVSPCVWIHKTATVAPTAYIGGPSIIGAHTVVQHHIRQDAQPLCVEGIDGGQIRIFCAVFSGNAALLVKFAQIVKIVDTVAHVLNAGLTLVGRGKPDIGDAEAGQISGSLRRPPRVAAVLRQVPFK